MEFSRQESVRAQEREQQRQTQQTIQQRQAQADARQQQSQALQQQMDQQHQREGQQQQQTRHEAQDRAAGQKEVARQQDEQRKKRQQTQERNRDALKRQPRYDGPAKPQPPMASKAAAVPPGPQIPTPALKPGAALQQLSKDTQVAEASRAGVKQVLAEKSENTTVKDTHKAAEKPVTTKQAAQLLDVAGRLGINSHNLLQKEGEVTAPPTKQEIGKALETASALGVRPEVMQRLQAAEHEAKPEPERAPKAPEQERDMGR